MTFNQNLNVLVCANYCAEAEYGDVNTKSCEACGFKCKTCTSATVCTDCYSPLNLVNDACECATGVLLANGNCYMDPDPCDGKPYIYFDTGICTATCKDGTYLSNSLCYTCGVGCTTCTTSADCVSCTPWFTLNA